MLSFFCVYVRLYAAPEKVFVEGSASSTSTRGRRRRRASRRVLEGCGFEVMKMVVVEGYGESLHCHVLNLNNETG